MNDELDTIEKIEPPKMVPAEVRPSPAASTVESSKLENGSDPSKPSGNRRPSRKGTGDDEDDDGFFQRHRPKIIVGTIVLIAGGWVAFHKPTGPSQPARKAPEPQMVRIQPLPPPPPPPPKVIPPPPKEEKLPEQAPMAAPDKKPEGAKPKPVDKPPEGLGTNIKGPGQGLTGLGSGSGNGMIGGTGTGPGGGGSAAAWYAGQVQGKVAEALRNHRKTRNASMQGVKVSVSMDGTGHITATKLLTSTGDTALDEALRNEILSGIRLQEPPPGGKPMTVTMVLNARRPK